MAYPRRPNRPGEVAAITARTERPRAGSKDSQCSTASVYETRADVLRAADAKEDEGEGWNFDNDKFTRLFAAPQDLGDFSLLDEVRAADFV